MGKEADCVVMRAKAVSDDGGCEDASSEWEYRAGNVFYPTTSLLAFIHPQLHATPPTMPENNGRYWTSGHAVQPPPPSNVQCRPTHSRKRVIHRVYARLAAASGSLAMASERVGWACVHTACEHETEKTSVVRSLLGNSQPFEYVIATDVTAKQRSTTV